MLHSAASDLGLLCLPRGLELESELAHIIFMKIDREIISTVILPLLLIQEWQLLVTCESMHTKYWLTA